MWVLVGWDVSRPGPKPKGSIRTEWDADLAYAVGLITSDGNLSNNGRLFSLVSKDLEMVVNFLKCLKISYPKIGRHTSSMFRASAYRVQISNVHFYEFLVSIGLTPKKSKTIGVIDVPDKFFNSFLRGVFDGDGYTHDYSDPRWPTSKMLYIGFCSASMIFIEWLRTKLQLLFGVKGHIAHMRNDCCHVLRFSKNEACTIINAMYLKDEICLSRKKLKIMAQYRRIGRQFPLVSPVITEIT